MAFDAHKNLAVSAVVTAPTPATSGTSLSVTAGEGQRFPVAPFNATVWPANAMPTPLTGEVIRVTARATDTLTIVRAQEGSTARTIGTGDLIAATITAKTLTDLETQAALLGQANQFTVSPQTIGPVANPGLVFHDAGVPADARLFRLMNSVQYLHVAALNDAQTAVLSTPLMLNRGGDAFLARDLYEKGRAAALGAWVDIPFNPANFSALSGGPWTVTGAVVSRNRYTLIGKVCLWSFFVSPYGGGSTLAASATALRLTLPAGLQAPASQTQTVVYAADGGGRIATAVDANPSGTTVDLYKAAGAWVAGQVGLGATLTLEVY